MTTLLPDVPVIIVLLHLAALAVMLSRVAVVLHRRADTILQGRNLPDPLWLRLLYTFLSLLK